MGSFLKWLGLGFFVFSLSLAQDDPQFVIQTQKFFEEKNWERFCTNLQKILSRHTGGDFSPLQTYSTQVCDFVTSEESAEYAYSLFHSSIRTEIVRPEKPVLQMGGRYWAEELLIQLEEEGLQRYRDKFDLFCEDVQKAIDQQHLGRLAKIAREFLFTSYGPVAIQALSEFCLEQNEPEIAISYLKRLLIYRADAIQNRPRTLCMLAYAYHLTEDVSGLTQCKQWMKELLRTEELLKQSSLKGKTVSEKQLRLHFAKLFRQEKLSLDQDLKIRIDKLPSPEMVLIAGKKVDPVRYIDQLLEKNRMTIAEDWPVYGGNFQRNRISDTDFSKLEGQFRWSVSLPRVPIKPHQSPQRNLIPSFMPYQPVVADGFIYINTGLGLRAYNLLNGKEKWPEYKGFLSRSTSFDETGSEGSTENLILATTIDRDQIYVNVEKKPSRAPDTFTPGAQTYNIQPIFPVRTLVCLDTHTGKQKWVVQTEKTRFEEANFSSAPVVYKNYLFCEANFYEGLVRSYLLCIDKYTGKIIYSLLISSGQTGLNMFGRPIRESLSTFLSEKEGILYFSNILGVLAAVEAYSGTILWILRYPQSPLSSPVNYEDSERPQNWYNNPVWIQDEFLIVAPPDSPQIMAVNRWSGKILWRRDRNSSQERTSEEKRYNRDWNLRYILGVADGKVFLSGDSVVALELASGRFLWKSSESDFNYRLGAYGRGVISSQFIYIPQMDYLARFTFDGISAFKVSTFSNEKLENYTKWKWSSGSSESSKVPKGGGNLVLWNGALVVASDSALAVFFDFQQTEQLLEQTLQKEPQNMQVMFRLAQLYLSNQNFAKAEEYFLKAKALATQTKSVKLEQSIQNGLYRLYLAKAEQERRVAKKISLYQDALKMASSIQEEVPVYLAMIDLYKSNREKNGVIDTWKIFLEKYGEQEYSFSGESIKIAPYVWDQMAKYYTEQNEANKAIACYQQILENYPKERVQYQEGAVFAERQIKALIQQFGRSAYAEQEAKAKALFMNAQKQSQSELYIRVLKYYPNSEIREQCQFALIETMMQNKTFSEDLLEQIKYLVQNYPQSPRIPQLFFYLFQIYYQQGKLTQAKNTLRVLLEKYPQKSVSWEQETFSIEKWAQTLQDERLTKTSTFVQEPELVLSENPSMYTWFKRFSSSESLSVILPKGSPPELYESRFYVVNGTTLHCMNVHKNEIVWVRGLKFVPEQLTYRENSLLILGKNNVLSLSLGENNVEEEWEMTFAVEAKKVLLYQDLFATVYEEKKSFWLALFDAQNGHPLERPVEVCSSTNFEPELLASQDFIVVGTRAPVRYYVFSLASSTLQGVIDANSYHPPGTTKPLILEPNLFFFLDRERVGSEELVVLKAYDLARVAPKSEPLWVNTKFARLNSATLVGKGDTLGVFQEMNDEKRRNQIISLEAKTGALRWQYPEPLNSPSWVIWDWEYVFFVVLEPKPTGLFHRIFCLRAKDGELVWKSSQLPGASRLKLKNTKNYLGCHIENQNLNSTAYTTHYIFFDKETGKMLRKYELNGKNVADEAIIVDTALVLAKDSTIYSYTSK